MNYHIDQNAAAPAYIQLYYLLRDDIISGAYPYGSRMPSKRMITAETSVSIITVEHAFALLVDEGYLESRPRSGYYVIYRAADFQLIPSGRTQEKPAAETKRPAALYSIDGSKPNADASELIEEESAFAEETVPHNAAEFPFSVLSKTMRRVIADYGDRIMTKSPNAGCRELRAEICAYLARSRGMAVQPSQVVIGSGAEYLYGLIAQLFHGDIPGVGSIAGDNTDEKAFFDKTHIFALEDPSYDKIRKVYASFSIDCDMLKLAPDGIQSEELAKTHADVLHVTPFNSFPSGSTATISKKREYLAWAKERGGFIIEDNFDSEMTVSKKAEDTLFSLSDGEDVIYINTFSKTIAPSIRVGYMLLPECLLEVFRRKLGFYSCTVPVFEQYVLAALLHSGDFERHINRVRRLKRK